MSDGSPLKAIDFLRVLAVVVITGSMLVSCLETVSWLFFRESSTTTLSCLVLNDPSTGVRAIPGAECRQSSREGRLVDYKFNRCGHRSELDCGPKPADTTRIVLVGSSVGYGMHVNENDSFASLLPQLLSARTGRHVDLYNESMQWGFPSSVVLRLDSAISAHPDVILWPITPTDISSVDLITPTWLQPGKTDVESRSPWQRLLRSLHEKGLTGFISTMSQRLVDQLNETRSMFLVKHLLYKSESLYIKQYLARADDDIAYLKSTPSARLQRDLDTFSERLTELQIRAKEAGATVVVTTIPDRAQAAMISRNNWPSDADPFRLGNEIRRIAENHGITYLDVAPLFRSIPNAERNYYAIDGHPDALGHAVIAEALATTMTNARIL